MRHCYAQYLLWAVVAALAIATMVSGCGAKGDLYLPSKGEQTTQQ